MPLTTEQREEMIARGIDSPGPGELGFVSYDVKISEGKRVPSRLVSSEEIVKLSEHDSSSAVQNKLNKVIDQARKMELSGDELKTYIYNAMNAQTLSVEEYKEMMEAKNSDIEANREVNVHDQGSNSAPEYGDSNFDDGSGAATNEGF